MPRYARVARRAVAIVRSRSFLGASVIAVILTLVVLNGAEGEKFVVDEITLGLLALAAIPFLPRIATSFKAGGVEVAFRELSVAEQVIVFLDGIATNGQWTFFPPRAQEEFLGRAFVVLTDELLKGSRRRLLDRVRIWLASDDLNQRWFAAEIIGFHKIQELRRAVGRAPESNDPAVRWEDWELNCLWAYSRLETPEFETLRNFLRRSDNRENQRWILESFDQMIEARCATSAAFADAVRDFQARNSDRAHDLAQGLMHIQALLGAGG